MCRRKYRLRYLHKTEYFGLQLQIIFGNCVVGLVVCGDVGLQVFIMRLWRYVGKRVWEKVAKYIGVRS